MAVNVNSSVTDPFYRYKMPRLLAKVEGKGNGIKTVIANMTDIAKALERPPMYPTKYFGCELGAQTQFDEKNDRYIVNGEHDAGKLQSLLDGFIKKFVLCKNCDNPETTLSVKKNQIHSKCKACGHAFVIDNKHKLATYIVKNPPKKEVDLTKVKENGNGTVHADEAGHEETNNKGSSNEEDDDDWEPEPTNGTEQDKLSGQMSKLVLDADLDKSLDERLDMLHQFFIQKKKDNQLGDGKILLDEAERLELKHKAPLLLVNVLLDENIHKEKQLQTYRTPLLRFTLNDKKAQRYLLGGIEQLIAKHEKDLLQFAPHIIKSLYDHDICTEEAILAWAEKPSSKYVAKTKAKEIIQKCEAFITWLKEAEEESSDEDSEAEIDFDNRTNHTTEALQKAKDEAEKQRNKIEESIKVVADDGNEIDIDDI